ncbi:N-acetylmuramoyl-L-alanine amidase-like domain-containing protein [Flammeovirga sp. EKP202]|uniref:N-acetylmuramoyl-L-alanine amidase-like domain-containing protein n=1 Tax=Flammeovirga sp. EKP202 TaxID=2770592 RepID=UPI00165F0B55|nr:N-acetylmuramoyl-L-alanine amidase-like domain-containing protein [Flammeovirga sp. EKP202]MBD0403991.1 DUF1460 domain-containing protein [Flammeovirga sp. EKP202]
MFRYFFSFIITLFITFSLQAQIVCSNASKIALDKKIEELNKMKVDTFNIPLREGNIARIFLDTPYLEKTLEIGKKEELVINFVGFDCTTFVESVTAMNLLFNHAPSLRNLNHYATILERLRYRNGQLTGYGSRLHYFTEWVLNNQKKGILKDMTLEIGGQMYNKKINFMSTHISSYKRLIDNDSAVNTIRVAETTINQQPLSQIYIKDIAAYEDKIQEGDIIALVTKINGLDVSHVGIAVKKLDRIHLLHASQSSGKVVITNKPLAEWLKNSKLNTGITVARLNP